MKDLFRLLLTQMSAAIKMRANNGRQYVDPYGKAEKIEDVFSKIKLAREHYEKVGLGGRFC
jgi:hypothetical protein